MFENIFSKLLSYVLLILINFVLVSIYDNIINRSVRDKREVNKEYIFRSSDKSNAFQSEVRSYSIPQYYNKNSLMEQKVKKEDEIIQTKQLEKDVGKNTITESILQSVISLYLND